MNLRVKLLADYYLGGVAHILLKPFVMLLGRILRRDHSLDPTRLKELTIIKMLGGGSLIIAYPSLLALKKKYPNLTLGLVTTPAIKPFADLTGLFDNIILIRDDGIFHLVWDTAKAIRLLWCTSDLLDLEIHSRFSSIFTLLTCAYNRIGIYTDLSFGRRSLYTHLLFYNKYSPVHLLYDQVVRLLGVTDIDFTASKTEFQSRIDLQFPDDRIQRGGIEIGVAPGCSDYGKERMLTVDHWCRILADRHSATEMPNINFIGSHSDYEFSEQIIERLKPLLRQATFSNCCGKYPLIQSVALMRNFKVLYCIDSSLIHFARLVNVRTVSFWGPTDPRTRLRIDPGLREETYYAALSCSPCIHITLETPCYGNNVCMNASLDPKSYAGDKNPIWLARD